MTAPRSRADRVLPITRVVSAVIAPFLVAAFLVLFPWPGDTKDWFAWQITPTMSPMVLGSVYLGGAYFFVRVIRSSRWHEVAGGFVAVGTFAGLMGIATILHWGRFLHDNVAFWIWVVLYFTTPFLVFAVFFRNRREYRPGVPGDAVISRLAAALMSVGGAAALLTGSVLFLDPSRAIDIWPWRLTPLTARMLGAIFTLGLAGLGAIRERRWSAVRILLEVELIMLGLIAVAAIRAHDEFATSKPLTWILAAGFGATAVASVVLYARMYARTPRKART